MGTISQIVQNLYKSQKFPSFMASKIPKHVAIVLDGNRRFGRKFGLQPWKGHEYGLKKLEELFDWCQELGINELTLYTFSTENFNRTKKEVDYLFSLFKNEVEKMREKREGIFKDKIRFNFIGRLHMFDKEMRQLMAKIMEKTKNNTKFTVNFAMAYGSRQEITDSVRKIVKGIKSGKIKEKDITEQLITKNLYLQSEPDMWIRPGCEKRLSNFLLWQSSYSELFFMDKLWPEFTKDDLIECVIEFGRRERRFGK